jgi:hypothetical protein
MKRIHLMAICAATAGLASVADAQSRPVGGGARITFPSHSNHFSWESGHHGFHGGFGGGVWIVEREVPVVVKVETPAPPPSAKSDGPPPRSGEDRKPYVIGASYASLPGGCMKMIEAGGAFYYCGGDWYRQVGRAYRAVEQP